MAVVLSAVLVVAMAVPAFAKSSPGGGGSYKPYYKIITVEKEEEHHSSNNNNNTVWAPAPQQLTDADALSSFLLWNMGLNGNKASIVAAQMGNNASEFWSFYHITFTPGSNVAVYQGFGNGSVIETDTTADPNYTATVAKLNLPGLGKSTHAAAAKKITPP